MQTIDRLTQFCDGSGVQKHIIRACEASGTAGLRGKNCARLLCGAAIARLNPLYLQRLVRIDDQDAIHSLPCGSTFDEQGNGHHHVWPLRLGSLAFHLGADQGM